MRRGGGTDQLCAAAACRLGPVLAGYPAELPCCPCCASRTRPQQPRTAGVLFPRSEAPSMSAHVRSQAIPALSTLLHHGHLAQRTGHSQQSRRGRAEDCKFFAMWRVRRRSAVPPMPSRALRYEPRAAWTIPPRPAREQVRPPRHAVARTPSPSAAPLLPVILQKTI